MPIYEITDPKTKHTLSLEGDSPPTEQELEEIFSKFQGPGLIQKVAQVATLPIRGLRGLGVFTQRHIAGEKLGTALQRGTEAIKPGFVPQPGEKIGALAGEVAATAPAIAAAGGGSIWAQIAKGALSAGTLTSLMEASERGDIEPVDVATSAMLGGTIPLVGPSLATVARAIKGIGRVVAKAGSTLGREALDELEKNPRLLQQFKGTAEAVGEKVVAIQKALIEQHEQAGTFLDKARKAIGFREPFSTALKRVQQEGFKPASIQEIIGDFKLLQKDKIPIEFIREARKGKMLKGIPVVSGETQTLGEQAMEYTSYLTNIPEKTTIKLVSMPAKARLRDLIRLREKVDDFINYPRVGADVPQIGSADQHLLKTLRTKINSIMEKIPGGHKLREADRVYSESRTLYDDFQKELATQGKAEDVIRRVLMGGDIEDIIGRKGEIVKLLKGIEKAKGVELIGPAKAELAARSFRTAEPTGYSGIPAAALGPLGTAAFVTGTTRAAMLPRVLARPFESIPGRAGLTSLAALRAQRERP